MNEQEQAKGDLIKSVDSFFGFKVKESIVLLFVDYDFTSSHNVRLDNTPEIIESIADVVQKVPSKAQEKGVICISISEDMEKAQQTLLDALKMVLLSGSVPLDALATNGSLWVSLTGENGILDNTPSPLEYALAERGIFNFPSREDAIADIHKKEPSEGVQKEIRRILETYPATREDLRNWRTGIIEFCENYSYKELSDTDIAKLAFACADVVMSHALIYQLAETEKPSELMHLWQRVFRRTPEEYRFAVAEILAWSFALEGSRWFLPEVLPYCNDSSPTIQALLMALNKNLSPHMMSIVMKNSSILSSKDAMDSMLFPMVSSAMKYLVKNRKYDPDES